MSKPIKAAASTASGVHVKDQPPTSSHDVDAPEQIRTYPVYDEDKAVSPEFVGYVNELLTEIPDSETALFERFARIGIMSDVDLSGAELAEVQAGIDSAVKEIELETSNLIVGNGYIGATEVFGTREYLDGNYLGRASGAHFGLWGNSRDTAEKILSDQYQLLLKEKEKSDAERNLMLASITSLIEALEARDQYTRGHSENVAEIVVGMAKEMSFSSLDIENINIAGKLHDLGKIGVPDRILLKPGSLSKEEYLLIKKHPVIGATILEPITTLEPIIPAVLGHHERIDGNGYPKGLKNSNIPLWARILAVADTYHALISDRPYRENIPQENVLQIIEDARSNQLCPECADVFLKWIQEQPRDAR